MRFLTTLYLARLCQSLGAGLGRDRPGRGGSPLWGPSLSAPPLPRPGQRRVFRVRLAPQPSSEAVRVLRSAPCPSQGPGAAWGGACLAGTGAASQMGRKPCPFVPMPQGVSLEVESGREPPGQKIPRWGCEYQIVGPWLGPLDRGDIVGVEAGLPWPGHCGQSCQLWGSLVARLLPPPPGRHEWAEP